MKVEMGVTYEPVNASIGEDFEASNLLKDFVSSTVEDSTETEEEWSKTEKTSCTPLSFSPLYSLLT